MFLLKEPIYFSLRQISTETVSDRHRTRQQKHHHHCMTEAGGMGDGRRGPHAV